MPPVILAAFTPDTRAEKPVRSLHRKIGPRDVYLVMDAPKNSTVEFRAKGQVELWDPWTGETRPLRVLGETATGTQVELPLEDYEAQVVVFTPGRAARQPATAHRSARSAQIALDGEWEFELQPTMDNRYGDFRLPVTDKIIGPEARIFRHAVESGDATALAGGRTSTTPLGAGHLRLRAAVLAAGAAAGRADGAATPSWPNSRASIRENRSRSPASRIAGGPTFLLAAGTRRRSRPQG